MLRAAWITDDEKVIGVLLNTYERMSPKRAGLSNEVKSKVARLEPYWVAQLVVTTVGVP